MRVQPLYTYMGKCLLLINQVCTGARFGRKKSILYQIWFLSPPGFQQRIRIGIEYSTHVNKSCSNVVL